MRETRRECGEWQAEEEGEVRPDAMRPRPSVQGGTRATLGAGGSTGAEGPARAALAGPPLLSFPSSPHSSSLTPRAQRAQSPPLTSSRGSPHHAVLSLLLVRTNPLVVVALHFFRPADLTLSRPSQFLCSSVDRAHHTSSAPSFLLGSAPSLTTQLHPLSPTAPPLAHTHTHPHARTHTTRLFKG